MQTTPARSEFVRRNCGSTRILLKAPGGLDAHTSEAVEASDAPVPVTIWAEPGFRLCRIDIHCHRQRPRDEISECRPHEQTKREGPNMPFHSGQTTIVKVDCKMAVCARRTISSSPLYITAAFTFTQPAPRFCSKQPAPPRRIRCRRGWCRWDTRTSHIILACGVAHAARQIDCR